jgi:hypothetical protein
MTNDIFNTLLMYYHYDINSYRIILVWRMDKLILNDGIEWANRWFMKQFSRVWLSLEK